MRLAELFKAFEALPAREQELFAAFTGAHRLFNTIEGRSELARRHARIDAGHSHDGSDLEKLLHTLEAAPPPGAPVAGLSAPRIAPR